MQEGYMRRLKQLFCLHYPVNFLMECGQCGKEFSRHYPSGKMRGLDNLKARFNQLRCTHTMVDGKLFTRWCSKCYYTQGRYAAPSLLTKIKQLFCKHKYRQRWRLKGNFWCIFYHCFLCEKERHV